MPVVITKEHGKTQNEAIQIIDDYSKELMTQSFPGVKIKNPQKQWRTNRLEFNFIAKKSAMLPGIKVTGSITVTETTVSFSANVREELKKIIPMEKVRPIIENKFNELFLN